MGLLTNVFGGAIIEAYKILFDSITEKIEKGWVIMDKIRVVLPSKYDLVLGDTFQLFYRGVVEAPNPFCYDILSVSEVGRNYPRYYEYTPDKPGEHLLTISVFDAQKNLLGKGETILNVCEPKAPEKETNILCIGDSLTGGGEWVTECYRRLTGTGGEPCGLGFSNINFIGTCKCGDVGHEGYGGWQWATFTSTSFDGIWVINMGHIKTDKDQHSIWKDADGNLWQMETIRPDMIKFMRRTKHDGVLKKGTYLEHIEGAEKTEAILIEDTLNESVSPFLNKETKKIEIKNYCKKHGYSGIDYVYVMLGYNGLHVAKVPLREHCKSIVADAKRLVDIIHEEYPDAKFRIAGFPVPSVTGGMGQYGAKLPYCDDYGMARFTMDLNIAYEEWTKEEEYKDFMEFINLSGQFDTDYSLPFEQKKVNTRSKITEMFGTNGIHPSFDGYMQIADCMFRSMAHIFK